MWTLAELGRLGVASIGGELVAPAARVRLSQLRSWGPRAAHFAAFECRLDGRDPRVDVSFALEGRRARAAVRHWLRAKAPQTEASASEQRMAHAYAQCGALLSAWAAESGPLSTLGGVWIEVDLLGNGQELPFAYFRPEQAGQFFQREDAGRVQSLLEAWARVSDGALQATSAARLSACIAALPAGARVLLIAPQLRARTTAVRMSFRLSADRLSSYLDSIGWPGAREALAEQLVACGATHWAMPIQIDIVGGELAPGISLEFTQSRENDYGERYQPLLDQWLRRGVCAEEKAAALVDWRERSARTEDEEVLGVQKLLDLKLTIAGDGKLSAKAYLGTLGVNRYFAEDARESRELSPEPSGAD